MIRNLLLVLILASISFFVSAQNGPRALPQVYTLASVRVEGLQSLNPTTIKESSGLVEGMTLTLPGPELGKAIKKLWEMKMFADIQVDVENIIGNQAYLVVRVQERPRITAFAFNPKGVTNSQADDLREKIGFMRMSIWTPEKERRATREIRNYFIEKGFFNVKVDIQTKPDTNFRNGMGVIPYITIEKGAAVKIKNIKIEGNQDFSDDRLVKKMKDLKEERFYRIWARSKYTPKKMESAQDNLIAFYRTNGYRDAEVLADTVYNIEEDRLEVSLTVNEGGQYYIRDIQITGNYKYSSDTLLGILGIEKGEIYNSEAIGRRISGDPNGRDIASLYQDDGYLFFNVDPVEIRIVGDSVDLELRVFEGPQATIRKVIIEGNTKTSDFVILRELRTLPGRKFSRADLIRSQREILALNYFNQENLDVIPIPDPANGTVDLKYIVEEKPSDQLQIQGGWGGKVQSTNGNYYGGGLVGTVQLGFNNFSTRKFFQKGAWNPVPAGDGQRLNIAAQLNGTGWQNYSISFMEPWLGGRKPNSLGASVFYTINKNYFTDFRMKTVGATVDYGMRLKWPDDFFRSYTSLGYKYYDLRSASSMFGMLDFDSGFINVFTLKETLDRTSIDAPIYPRSGSQLTLSGEATPPFSLFQPGKDYRNMSGEEKFKFLEYYKIKFTSNWYFQVVKNLVIRPRVMFGYLGQYNPDYGVSPFERFNMGGSGLSGYSFYGWEFISMRGYPDGSIGHIMPGSFTTTPGNVFAKYTFEVRYPITLNQSAPIWTVGFLEAGNNWLGVRNVNPFELKRSAGVGVRVMLPMVGLLGVDWGYGFDRSNAIQTKPAGSNFTFILGQEF